MKTRLFRIIILAAIMVAGAWIPVSFVISCVPMNHWDLLNCILSAVPFVLLPASIYMEMRHGGMSKWSLVMDVITLIALVAFDCMMEFVPIGWYFGG